MMPIKSTVATLMFAGLAVVHGAVPVRAEGGAELKVAPLKVINMDAGAKRAIGYYLAENGACNLTVLLSDVTYEPGASTGASRVNVNVAAGTSAKVDTIDGTTMAFTCAPGASAMTVNTFQRYAYSPAAAK